MRHKMLKVGRRERISRLSQLTAGEERIAWGLLLSAHALNSRTGILDLGAVLRTIIEVVLRRIGAVLRRTEKISLTFFVSAIAQTNCNLLTQPNYVTQPRKITEIYKIQKKSGGGGGGGG